MPRHKLPDKNFDWTPELAYVIGLLTTDGNLSKDGRHIIMRSSDLQLLNTFKKCIGLENKVAQTKNDSFAKRPCYKLQFGDVQLYRWLLKIGLFPAKSYTIGPLKIADQYFSDFLRGHIDGDGSIITYKDYYNTFKNPAYIYTRLYICFRSASKNHIEWLRGKTTKLYNIKGSIAEQKPRRKEQSTSIWILKFAKKESIKLLHWIYYKNNLPCLKRKKKVAEKALKLLANQKRKKYAKQKK